MTTAATGPGETGPPEAPTVRVRTRGASAGPRPPMPATRRDRYAPGDPGADR